MNSIGEETLSGCLVLPILGAGAAINGFCGVKPCTGSTPEQIVVPRAVQGLIRGALLKGGSRLYITSRVLDVFALWLAGFRNVVMLATFVEAMKVHGYSPATLRSYRASLGVFLAYLGQAGIADVREVESATVRGYPPEPTTKHGAGAVGYDLGQHHRLQRAG